MKKLELVEEKVEITFKGESHLMRLPSNLEVMALGKEKEEDDYDSMNSLLDFFAMLGLPKEFSGRMSPNHTIKIMESITDVKS